MSQSSDARKQIQETLRGIRSPADAWEILAARGCLPDAWINDPNRWFFAPQKRAARRLLRELAPNSAQRECGTHINGSTYAAYSHPTSIRDVITLAAQPDKLLRIESLAREVIARTASWRLEDNTRGPHLAVPSSQVPIVWRSVETHGASLQWSACTWAMACLFARLSQPDAAWFVIAPMPLGRALEPWIAQWDALVRLHGNVPLHDVFQQSFARATIDQRAQRPETHTRWNDLNVPLLATPLHAVQHPLHALMEATDGAFRLKGWSLDSIELAFVHEPT